MQLAVVVGAAIAYETMRLLIPARWGVALGHARALHDAEGSLGLAWEGGVQGFFLRWPLVVEAIGVFYLLSPFVLSVVFLVWLYRRSRTGFGIVRDAYLLSLIVTAAVAWRYPVAPPRTAGIGLEDTLLTLSGIDIGSPGARALTNPVAAFPSLHVGWAVAVGFGLMVYGRGRSVRAVGVVYPLLVTLSVIVTGNHFVLDGVAGAAVVTLGLALGAARGRMPLVGFKSRRGVEQPGSSPGS